MGKSKITKEQKQQVSALFKQGESNKAIAKKVNIGYSSVCKLTSKSRNEHKKGYSINVSFDDYEYITEFANKRGMSKNIAFTEIVRLAKRKCLFTWG